MAFLHPAVAEGIKVVVRQAAETATALISEIASPTPAPSPTGGSVSSSPTISSASASDTFANGGGTAPTLPPTQNGGPGNPGTNNGNGNNSSPLLFFVALGFGVVFTNLWIIVGVKYCFRYNARNRQMRMNEDGEPINMENMPRPHRRRREKKLMTMDEVNEKFPMMKYKSWVATRVQEGLPTRGGVSPPSRAGSVRDVDGVAPELPSKERMSADERPTTSAAASPDKQGTKHAAKESTSSTVNPATTRTSTDARLVPTVSESATISKEPNRDSRDDDEEDDEHINAALPPECMGTSGDTCAICIDTLEDDDDVRGLTCGHAFHAVCLDPWLTSRRACCPLCKADYYTPKPRPHAPEPGDGTTTVITVTLPGDRRGRERMNMPNRPRHAFFGLGGRSDASGQHSNNQPSSRRSTSRPDNTDQNRLGLFSVFSQNRPAQSSPPPATSPMTTTPVQPQGEQVGRIDAFRSAFPTFRLGRRQQGDSTAAVTPSNLEAGTRNPAS